MPLSVFHVRRFGIGLFLPYGKLPQYTKRGYNDRQKRSGSLNELDGYRTDRSQQEPPKAKETDREIIDLYRENIQQLCRRYSNDDGEGMESLLMAKTLESHRKHAAENPTGNRAAYVKKCLFNRAFHLYSLNRRQRDFEADAASRSLDAAPKDARGQRASAPLVECL